MIAAYGEARKAQIRSAAISLHGRVVERLPQVQRGDRAVRPPALTQRLELLGGWQALEPVQALHRPSDPEIPDRKHVGPAEVEDQEHVGGPLPEALDGRKLGGDLLVGELAQPLERELP